MFDAAWHWLLPKLTEADFTEWRRQRAFDISKRAMWNEGCKLPTQVAEGPSRCYCAEIDIAGMDQHIYAAHLINN